jgi:integrase/recombinase XerD
MGTLKEAWRLGLVDAESYYRAVDLLPVRGSSLPAGRAVSQGEELAIFKACADDKTAAGARDGALLAILAGAGLQRSEVVALNGADYEPECGKLTIQSGKGKKARITFLKSGGSRWLGKWLQFRGGEPGALLCPMNKGGRVEVRRLSSQAVMVACMKRAAQAGTDPISPHDCRRTWIGNLLSAGADISTVQRLAGHANVTTTARYVRRGEEQMDKASGLVHVPYFE